MPPRPQRRRRWFGSPFRVFDWNLPCTGRCTTRWCQYDGISLTFLQPLNNQILIFFLAQVNFWNRPFDPSLINDMVIILLGPKERLTSSSLKCVILVMTSQAEQLLFGCWGLNWPKEYVHIPCTSIYMVHLSYTIYIVMWNTCKSNHPASMSLTPSEMNIEMFTNLSVLMQAHLISFLEVKVKNWQHITIPKDLSGRSQYTI